MRRSLRTVGSRRLAQVGTPPARRARKPMGRSIRRSRAPRSDWEPALTAFSLPCTPHPRCRLAQQLLGPFVPAGGLGSRLSPGAGLSPPPARPIGWRGCTWRGWSVRDCFFALQADSRGVVVAVGAEISQVGAVVHSFGRARQGSAFCFSFTWSELLAACRQVGGGAGLTGLWFLPAAMGIRTRRLSPSKGRTADLWSLAYTWIFLRGVLLSSFPA